MAKNYELSLSIKNDCYDFVDKKTRAVAMNFLRGVVQETPVDTGLARSNWQASLNNRNDKVNHRYSSLGNAIRRGGEVIKGFKISDNDTLFIQNHLPYIERLNNGWSQQAPSKFVEMIIDRVTR